MSYDKKCFSSFNKDNFNLLIKCLLNQGYVIEEENLFFGFRQIGDLSQSVFNDLCKKFNINDTINIFSFGGFSEKHGPYSMVYNKNKYEYEDAKKLLNSFISNI